MNHLSPRDYFLLILFFAVACILLSVPVLLILFLMLSYYIREFFRPMIEFLEKGVVLSPVYGKVHRKIENRLEIILTPFRHRLYVPLKAEVISCQIRDRNFTLITTAFTMSGELFIFNRGMIYDLKTKDLLDQGAYLGRLSFFSTLHLAFKSKMKIVISTSKQLSRNLTIIGMPNE